jgi:vacuolar-type H+-ATPase subunit I/STV1
LDSGVGSGEEMGLISGATVEDQCGDDVVDSSQHMQALNLDPVTQLLEKLKFELFQSLTYEHDTTNATHRQCANEVRQQDRDLEQLQREVLLLGKTKDDMDALTRSLTEKRDSLSVQVADLGKYVSEIARKIESSRTAHDNKFASEKQELDTLQNIRKLITEMSGHECSSTTRAAPSFRETAGTECFGELLSQELSTKDPEDCKNLCVTSCVAFTFHSNQGCRFYSSMQQRVNGCAGEVGTCSCFEKM